jgi:hypothetical protein
MPYFAGILQAPVTFSKLSCCLHTAEVAGSNPASPTKKYLQMAENGKPPVDGKTLIDVQKEVLAEASEFCSHVMS